VKRTYQYVGPEGIRRRNVNAPAGSAVVSATDLTEWVRQTNQEPDHAGVIAATFVVDELGILRVADRRSEHIACSGGRPVLSAGELFVRQSGAGWEVVEVSNLSTGFCPEPESWPVVAETLDSAGIAHPGGFTVTVIFRRCPACGERNVVRDGWFVCGTCGAELPAAWNFETTAPSE
jgi:hypothetical protein